MNSSNNIPGQSRPGGNTSREQIAEIREKGRSDRFGETDDFDRDAIEGWEKASGGTELMQKLDRKFAPKSRLVYLVLAILLVGFFAALFLLPAGKAAKPALADAGKVTVVDKSDVVISEDIKAFEELPAALQIKPDQVGSNFRTKDRQDEQRNPGDVQDNEHGLIPPPVTYDTTAGNPIEPRKAQPYAAPVKKLSIERKTAKEIYLSDLKLVDYRPYREKREVKSEQLILSGTSADQEQITIQHDDPAWKVIDIPYYDYISQTVKQFKDGNFKQTLNRTKAILEFYPDDINALFYGGLCYYNLSEMDLAIDAFQKVMNNPFSNFDQEALWYLANAYDLKNDRIRARELYFLISAQKGYYAKQADRMLKR